MALPSLPLFHRLSGQPVILLGAGEAADAKRRLLERAGAIVSDDPALRGARLAFVALDGPDADHAAALLRARGLLVNVVDRPDLCDFTTPAIVDRAPVIIAIGTGGASAGLAKELRQRLETLLPAGLGKLADALFAARPALRARWPLGADRRRAIDAALAPGGALDPLAALAPGGALDPLAALAPGGALDPLAGNAVQRVDDWLAKDGDALAAGVVHTVLLTSADPDDLTLRQARWLASADHLCHTPAVPTAILDRARADATRTPCGARAPVALQQRCTACPHAHAAGVTVRLDAASAVRLDAHP